MAFFELTLPLMAMVVVLELAARRLHLPPAGAFVIGGGALALIPRTPSLRLDPDLMLVLFLPPLLTAGLAASGTPRSSWSNLWYSC